MLSPVPTRLPPLPTTPPDTPYAYACIGGVCIMLAPLQNPTKKSPIFRIVACAPIPNCDPVVGKAALQRGHRTRHN